MLCSNLQAHIGKITRESRSLAQFLNQGVLGSSRGDVEASKDLVDLGVPFDGLTRSLRAIDDEDSEGKLRTIGIRRIRTEFERRALRAVFILVGIVLGYER